MENKKYTGTWKAAWEAAWEAVYATPEYEAKDEAWKAVKATPEYEAYLKADEVVKATPEYKDYEKAWNMMVAGIREVADYAPDIKMVYGRRADGYVNKSAYYLYQYIQTVGANIDGIPGLADDAGANCLVVRDAGETSDNIMETAGWRKTGDVDVFSIYCK